MSDTDRINHAFQYPLFEALAHRRVRRFGLGYKINDGTMVFDSKQPPVPLDKLETALVAWSSEGPNGIVLGEQQLSTNVHSSWAGRTHPCPCNMQNSILGIANDDGIFFYKMPQATKPVEIENEADRLRIPGIVWDNTIQTDTTRPNFPNQAFLSSNLWGVNMPGSSFFMPILDMTGEYINFCLFAFEKEKYYIKDTKNNQPCGLKKWIDSGYFSETFYLPLLMYESFVYNVVIGMAHYKAQNMALVCEAVGLGNWTYSGFTPMVVLGGTPFCRGFGATFVTGKDGMPNPVAISNQLQSFCPPNYKNMDEAVDAVMDIRWGNGGIFTANPREKTPFKDWPEIQKGIPRPSKEAVQATKDFCNYIYDEYGRFPAHFDSLQTPVGATIHHLDCGFYDRFYPQEVLTAEHRDHMKIWHG